MDALLTAVIADEDNREDLGTLEGDDRLTCYTCQTWATEEHVNSDEHWKAIGF